MSQEATNDQQTTNMPFRAKSAWVSLFIISIFGMYYFVNVWRLWPSDDDLPEGALNLVIGTVLLIVIVEIILHFVLLLGAGKAESRTKNDEIVFAKASHIAYTVLTVGVVVTVASMFVGFTVFQLSSVLVLAFLLAEIAKFASQIVYYWRST